MRRSQESRITARQTKPGGVLTIQKALLILASSGAKGHKRHLLPLLELSRDNMVFMVSCMVTRLYAQLRNLNPRTPPRQNWCVVSALPQILQARFYLVPSGRHR